MVQPDEIEHVQTVYVRHHGYEFPYMMYRYQATTFDILLNTDEHKAHMWVTPEEALQFELIQDEDECIKTVYFDWVRAGSNSFFPRIFLCLAE